jgi:hypothetical protein
MWSLPYNTITITIHDGHVKSKHKHKQNNNLRSESRVSNTIHNYNIILTQLVV